MVFVDTLLNELDGQLDIIEQNNNSIINRSELSFKICKAYLEKLKKHIIKYKFSSDMEEIIFFKEVKPRFSSKLIYHLTMYNIETKKPNGGNKVMRKYLIKELEKLKNYFEYNIDFYKYYRAGANYLDDKYFLRNKHDIQLHLDAYIFENDTRFSTTHDYKVAKILAHDLLEVHLEHELLYLERRNTIEIAQDEPKTKLNWIESKTALIELIYALHTQQVFGKQADIKEISLYFENVFNIDLGDYYRTYLELRTRKTGSIKFIDELRNGLLKRMQNQDDF